MNLCIVKRGEMNRQILQSEDGGDLYERLAAYAKSDYYPFHMPGHKRAELNFMNPYQIDITEIEGFDNLHHAKELLLDAQKRLADIYHSKKLYYLVNGSTCGILSAVGAAVRRGDHVLVARNCHKSVYHAIKLFGLKADYIYPQFMDCGIQGIVETDQIEDALKTYGDIRLVILTSPTYDGIVSDIRKIADLAHKYNACLFVDEAHGAHFSLSRFFPESAIHQGADLVVHSLHKTLPAFTQTAALHVASDRTDCGKLEEMLGIFQSSSPSYLLMAGIDRCAGIIERSGRQLFEQYQERLDRFYEACTNLKYLHVMTGKDYEAYHVPAFDQGKILVQTKKAGMDGVQLYHILLERYHLQMEMCTPQYVLAMTSLMDTQEGFDRLFWALLETDREVCVQNQTETSHFDRILKEVYAVREKVMEISDAADFDTEETDFEDCVGKICAEYIYLYPPGIPMIVPGEKISDGLIQSIGECRKMGLQVQGMRDRQCGKVLTVYGYKANSQ